MGGNESKAAGGTHTPRSARLRTIRQTGFDDADLEAGRSSLALTTPEISLHLPGYDRLLDDLRPAIERGEFGIVVGTDPDGRIAARMVHAAVNAWNQENGRPHIPLVFVPGSSMEGARRVLHAAAASRHHLLPSRQPASRALIVTGELSQGGSIADIGSLLSARNIPFDVATVGGNGFRRDGGRGGMASRSDIDRFASQLDDMKSGPAFDESQLYEIWNVASYAQFTRADYAKLLEKLRKGSCTVSDFQNAANRKDTSSKDQPNGMELAKMAVYSAKLRTLSSDATEELIGLLMAQDINQNDFRDFTDQWHLIRVSGHDALHESVDILTKRGIPRVRRIPGMVEVDAVGWPVETRLFRGLSAETFREGRASITGLRDDACGTAATPGTGRDPDRIRTARNDIRTFARWTTLRFQFENPDIARLMSTYSDILMGLKPHVLSDEYGCIVGEEFNSRIHTLILGRAINDYRNAHGLHSLPVVFTEGSGIPFVQGHIEGFAARAPLLAEADRSKRALVVSSGENARSVVGIMERLHELGFASDVVYTSEISQAEANDIATDGSLRRGTRAFAPHRASVEESNLFDTAKTGVCKPDTRFDLPRRVRTRAESAGVRGVRRDIALSAAILSFELG